MVLSGPGSAPVLGQQAQESAETLKRTQQELQKAREAKRALAEQRETLAKDLQQLRQKLIHAAQDTQEREGIITNLEGQLDQLAAEKKRRSAALRERGHHLSGTLSALTRLSRNPRNNHPHFKTGSGGATRLHRRLPSVSALPGTDTGRKA